jgi:hypothetical protein
MIQNKGAAVALPADEKLRGIDNMQGGSFYRRVHWEWMGWHGVVASARPRSGSASVHARA